MAKSNRNAKPLKVINRNKDGEIIKDLSKITLSQELSNEIYELLNPKYKAV